MKEYQIVTYFDENMVPVEDEVQATFVVRHLLDENGQVESEEFLLVGELPSEKPIPKEGPTEEKEIPVKVPMPERDT